MFQGQETRIQYLKQIARMGLFALSMAALAAVAGPFNPIENARVKIEHARSNGAEDVAPMTLRMAEFELRRAERMINANPSRPLTYEHFVEMAEYRANELEKVMLAIRLEPMAANEENALRIVRERFPHMSPSLTKNENLESADGR